MSLPLVILAGSDGRPVRLPEAGRSQHPIVGYKGVDLRIGERSLIACVTGRARETSWFDPIYVAGPASLYGPLGLEAEIIDLDASVGENIEGSMDHVRSRHPGSPVAYISCDVLPERATMESIRVAYEASAPAHAFFPLVRVNDGDEGRRALGASAWKPRYKIVPRGTHQSVSVLPGHLAIVDPEALKLTFLYRLLNLTYRTRNRPLEHRRNVLIRGIVWELLYQDLRHLGQLRAPTLTLTVIGTGLRVAMGLHKGDLGQDALERAVRRVLVTPRHRRRNPERRVVLPIIEALWLAQDIDTLEEAEALGAALDTRAAGTART